METNIEQLCRKMLSELPEKEQYSDFYRSSLTKWIREGDFISGILRFGGLNVSITKELFTPETFKDLMEMYEWVQAIPGE